MHPNYTYTLCFLLIDVFSFVAIIYLKMLLWVMVGFSNGEVSLQKRHNLLYVFVYNRIHWRNHILSAIGFVDFILTSPLSAFKNPKSRANIFECLWRIVTFSGIVYSAFIQRLDWTLFILEKNKAKENPPLEMFVVIL